MMKKMLGFILSLLLVGNVPHSVAQSMQEGKKVKDLSVRLDEVVVTGTGTEHYQKDAPVQIEVLTWKALEQFQARSMEELLSGFSSSLTFQDGDMGSRIQLNGLNNDSILILIDGERVNGDVGG